MQIQEIRAHVRPDGTVRYECNGVTADQWDVLSRVLADVLGPPLGHEHTCEFEPPQEGALAERLRTQA